MDPQSLINKFNIKSVSQLNNLISSSRDDPVVNNFLVANKSQIEKLLPKSGDRISSLLQKTFNNSDNTSNRVSNSNSINDRINRLSNKKWRKCFMYR